MPVLSEVNHRLESRIREIRSYGSEGGEIGPNPIFPTPIQGELKRGGFDPLFALNHTCAMFRDHLKRLSRRTWCTTKRASCLQDLLYVYAWFHNERLAGRGRLVRI